jgi:hypothetical protein
LLVAGCTCGCAGTASRPASVPSSRAPAVWQDGNPSVLGSGASASGQDVQGENDGSGGSGSLAAAAEEPEDGLAVHGSLVSRLVARRNSDDSDLDLYALLSVDVGDREQDDWTGYVLGRVSKDLDGDTGGEDSTFASLEDTYDDSLNGRLYEAYVEGHATGLEVLKLGRQGLYDTPEYVRIDGARLETEPTGSDRHSFGFYAGRPVHEYESSSDGDEALGIYAENRPWDGARARLDYMYLNDEELLGSDNNDLWAVQLDQTIDRKVMLHGDYSLLEDRPREYTVRGTWVDPQEGMLVQASHHELLSTQKLLVEEFDPFYESLLEYYPYRQEGLLVSKSFDEDFDLSGGADIRRVTDDDDIGEFNREFDRYHATGTWHDVFMADLSVALTAETWQADGSDEVATWGLDLTRVFTEDLRGSVGSYYALFKNDFLLEEEREDVRTYYVSLRYRIDPQLSWLFGYEYEDAEDDDYQTLRARATWRF